MAKHFSVPASPKVFTERLENFKGVDFANNATQVQTYRSPDAQNIISDLAGKPVKRTGYSTLATFEGQINGIFRLATENVEKILVHAGTKLYEWNHDDDRWLGIYVSKKAAREAYDRAVEWWNEEQKQMSFSTSQRVAMFEYIAIDDRFREVDRKELD